MHASLPPSKLRAIEKRRDERNVLLPLPAPVSAPAPSRTSTTASPNNAFITQQPSTTTTDVEINNNYVNEEKNSNANIDNDDDGDSAEVSPPQPGVWLKVPAKNIEYHWIDWDRIASIGEFIHVPCVVVWVA